MTLALLGAAAIALLAIEKTNPEVAESARGAAADVIAPILDLLSRPSASAAQAIDSVRELGRLREENAQLKQQQSRLLQWQTVAHRLDHENQELRKLLNLLPDPKARFVTARVVGGSGGAFVRSILVAAGSKDGVRKNQAAITGEGLIGRVSEVGERAADVRLEQHDDREDDVGRQVADDPVDGLELEPLRQEIERKQEAAAQRHLHGAGAANEQQQLVHEERHDRDVEDVRPGDCRAAQQLRQPVHESTR